MEYKSRLPTAKPGGSASGMRPPGSLQNRQRKSSFNGDNGYSSVGPSRGPSSVGPSRGGPYAQKVVGQSMAPGSGGTSVYGAGGRVSTVFSGRKNSLSGLSSTRKSMKPGGLFGVTPQTKRPSFQPGTGSSVSGRRSSIIGQSRHVQENRPLSDRGYHHQCFAKLMECLQEFQFPHVIPPKFLPSPPTNVVRNMFEFLFSLFDPKIKVFPLDAELPQQIKLVGYPFQINKSALKSWSSAQSVGNLLGMFEWLVDAVYYCQRVDILRIMFPSFNDELNINSELLQLCISKIDPEEQENALGDLVQRKFGTEQEFESLRSERDKLEGDVAELEEEILKISLMPTTLKTYENDVNKYDLFINDMMTHLETNRVNLQDLDAEYNLQKAEYDLQEERRNELMSMVESQEFGVDDAKYAQDLQKQIEEDIRAEEARLEELKKNTRLVKLDLTKCEGTLNKMHEDANTCLLVLVDAVSSPSIAAYVGPLKSHLENNDCKQLAHFFLDHCENDDSSKSTRNKFSRLVHEVQMLVAEQITTLQGEDRVKEKQKLADIDFVIEELENKSKTTQDEVESLQDQLKSIRRQHAKEANELDKEYNLNKQFLSEIGSKEKQTEEQLKDQVRALRREVEKEQEGHKKERREILDSAKAFIKKEKEGVDSLFGEMDVQKRWLQESLAKAKSVAKKEEKLQRHFEDKLKRGKETKRGQ